MRGKRDIEFIYLCEVYVSETMTQVEYIITETPRGDFSDEKFEDDEDDYETHARFTIWRGDDWKQCVLHWAISVSKHAPEQSTDYYITKIWRTSRTSHGPTLIDILHQPEDE